MGTKYTADYFIEKFSAIPEKQWTTGVLTSKSSIEGEPDCHCALGHCGMEDWDKPTEESLALVELFGGEVKPERYYLDTDFEAVYEVNDDGYNPKGNILDKLGEIKINSK